MRHFDFVDASVRRQLFEVPPACFERDSDPAVLANALGATLYAPSTRPDLAAVVERQARAGVTSMVLDLEDAVADPDLPAAEANLVDQLRRHHDGGHRGPLLFLRVRHPEQITDLAQRLGDAVEVLSGFVLPKFTAAEGPAFLQAMDAVRTDHGTPLYAMPVLEHSAVIHRETRERALAEAHALLLAHRDRVLAVRIGATDLSSAYGLRRSPDLTVYDVRVVAEVISDIVNVFGRADGSGFVVTGPVWEYFTTGERIFKPRLRQTIFAEHDAVSLRGQLIDRDLDGLIREVELDKANGLTGKTVIHPSHVPAVHALQVVPHEEYADACDIAGAEMVGGVMASGYRNKMNEVKPHTGWAHRTLARAQVFGVAAPDVTFVDLLAASLLR
ncbi:MAG TPA: HpcH/HpaI aldolase/citrate lyase family protein [Actinomycetales bacterium]|nr:HpcH/HpaI aldolase/citrate lyase family protein [Actinomycetales bacterium]